jgi:hypothetical protein
MLSKKQGEPRALAQGDPLFFRSFPREAYPKGYAHKSGGGDKGVGAELTHLVKIPFISTLPYRLILNIVQNPADIRKHHIKPASQPISQHF